MEAADDTSTKSSRRRRAMRWFALVAAFHAIVAYLVSVRSKAASAKRELERPDTYPSRTFDPVHIEGVDDEVQVYMAGTHLAEDLRVALESATDYIYVQTFIWIDDEAGNRLREGLEAAVKRGVRVHVMYDWLLSSRDLDVRLRAAGIRVFAFRPIKGRDALRFGNLLRDHRKVIVVDGSTGFVGGFNVGDEYLAWRDTHLRIHGESVAELENAFVDFWNGHRPMFEPALPPSEQRSWTAQIAVHRNDPSMSIFPIRGLYLETIDRATKNVWITNAYFVPDQAFRRAIEEAARRGVDVRIILPARSNHPLTDALAHGMFDDLLAAGVRILLYRDFMVHAKTMTVDGVWSTIGTANLDRSMLGNFEINAEVRSPELAAQMEQMFELDMEYAWEVQLDVWRRRPMHAQIAERTLKSFAPLM